MVEGLKGSCPRHIGDQTPPFTIVLNPVIPRFTAWDGPWGDPIGRPEILFLLSMLAKHEDVVHHQIRPWKHRGIDALQHKLIIDSLAAHPKGVVDVAFPQRFDLADRLWNLKLFCNGREGPKQV